MTGTAVEIIAPTELYGEHFALSLIFIVLVPSGTNSYVKYFKRTSPAKVTLQVQNGVKLIPLIKSALAPGCKGKPDGVSREQREREG